MLFFYTEYTHENPHSRRLFTWTYVISARIGKIKEEKRSANSEQTTKKFTLI